MGPVAMILVFCMLSVKPLFSLSSFNRKLFSSSLPSAIRVVSFAYHSLAFHMIYSAYELNKEDGNIQPWSTLFPVLNQYGVPCPVLTVVSWPTHSFLRKQVRWSGILISLRILQFVVIHTVKGFDTLDKAEVDVFLELSCFSDDLMDVGNLISGSSAFSKPSLYIWKFWVHIR